ncbi:MAG: hypothetical protein ABI939_06310 [Anaerolineaceae bacterium]
MVITFTLIGASIGLSAAFLGEYGWFTQQETAPRTSNLSPEQAEEFARGYAVRQLRLAQPQGLDVANFRGGLAIPQKRLPDESAADRPFVTIEARFLADGDTSSPGAAAVRGSHKPGGAWLFVFRAGGVEVAEWDTTNAVFEVQILLSDTSARVLQGGSALLPEIPAERASVRR